MQPLVRPTLFLIARLGLLLAVVAWIVGNWWVVGVRIGPLSIVSGPGGWEVRRWDTQIWNQMRTVCYSSHVHVPDAMPTLPPIWGIFIYHWLVVAVFALFYGVLKWAYRKQPETSPATHK